MFEAIGLCRRPMPLILQPSTHPRPDHTQSYIRREKSHLTAIHSQRLKSNFISFLQYTTRLHRTIGAVIRGVKANLRVDRA